MAATTGLAVLGAAGRMGRAVVRAVADSADVRLAAACERSGATEIGADAAALAGLAPAGVAITVGPPVPGAADVWIDFTAPAAAAANAQAAATAAAGLVIGTTGLGEDERRAITAAARKTPIVLAPNMSVGVNVLFKLVADAARALGPGYDLEIVEAHHRGKRDAPSGTALRLAEVLATATKRDLGVAARYARQGNIGPRPPGEIGIQTVRGGDVVGEHTAFFLGLGERLELTHRASSRDTFARGAVRAALWLLGKPAGLYDMHDVLGLEE